ncbi:unnamed protein product [Dibothriocephalus latus]|uniref:Uncharacterized protein n=1 Tax=Dibothriocephalus latus TaxID=60516 RepID=A0A3P7QR87_DIBLA|nr:unnamed protein product [Dibothriocephalus latus]
MTDKHTEDTSESHLFVGDSVGRIHVWNIQDYAVRGPETRPPPLLCVWRGHTKAISALEVVNSSQTIVTTSADRNVRLWKWDGSYIGTFGQPVRWNLNDPSTFQSPMLPFDVLIDPLSIPEVLPEETSDNLEATEGLSRECSIILDPWGRTMEAADREDHPRSSLEKTTEVCYVIAYLFAFS